MPETGSLVDALTCLAREEDVSAWELIVRREAGGMLGVAWGVLGDRHLAEDAVQDALVRIRRDAGRFRPRRGDAEAAARGWLRRAAWMSARRLARERASRARREARHAGRDGDMAVSGVVDQVAATDEAATVRAALAELPERYRLPLVLQFYGGLSHREIAAAVGCSEGNARVRVHRALGRLRTRLAALGASVLVTPDTVLPLSPPEPGIVAGWQGLLSSPSPAVATVAASSGGAMLMSTLTIGAGLVIGGALVVVGTYQMRRADDPPVDPPPVIVPVLGNALPAWLDVPVTWDGAAGSAFDLLARVVDAVDQAPAVVWHIDGRRQVAEGAVVIRDSGARHALTTICAALDARWELIDETLHILPASRATDDPGWVEICARPVDVAYGEAGLRACADSIARATGVPVRIEPVIAARIGERAIAGVGGWHRDTPTVEVFDWLAMKAVARWRREGDGIALVPATGPAPDDAWPGPGAAEWMFRMRQELEVRVSVKMAELDLEEVLEFLRMNSGLNIVMKASGPLPPISMERENVRLVDVLADCCRATGLSWCLRNEAVYVFQDHSGRDGSNHPHVELADDAPPSNRL